MATSPAPAAARFFKLFHRWNCIVGDTWHQPAQASPLTHDARRSRALILEYHHTAACHVRFAARRQFSTSPRRRSQAPSSNANGPDPAPSLPAQMRLLMRRIPYPVVVLTATHPNPGVVDPNDAQRFRAMTVSSFNTVCLEPRPVISFNMKLPSRTHDALEANDGLFLVHFLHSGPEGARLAEGFTKGQAEVGRILGQAVESGAGVEVSPSEQHGEAPFAVDVDAVAGSAPAISGPAVSRVLRCRLLHGKEVRVEDHVVLCAEVLGLLGPNEEPGHEAELSLVYVDRSFREVGREIDLEKGQHR